MAGRIVLDAAALVTKKEDPQKLEEPEWSLYAAILDMRLATMIYKGQEFYIPNVFIIQRFTVYKGNAQFNIGPVCDTRHLHTK